MHGNKRMAYKAWSVTAHFFLLLTSLAIVAFGRESASSARNADLPDITYHLEGYNHWNLPFAKTVMVSYNQTEESTVKNLYPGNYKLLVDPTAVFTVLFLPEVELDSSQLRTLNYTFFGDKDLYTVQGNWVEVALGIS